VLLFTRRAVERAYHHIVILHPSDPQLEIARIGWAVVVHGLQAEHKMNDRGTHSRRETRRGMCISHNLLTWVMTRPETESLLTQVGHEEYLRALGLNERQTRTVMYVKERGKIRNREYR